MHILYVQSEMIICKYKRFVGVSQSTQYRNKHYYYGIEFWKLSRNIDGDQKQVFKEFSKFQKAPK